MNRETYFNQLEKALASYPRDFREEIHDSFYEHFTEGNNNGLTDEEIIAELGSVEEVMENIRDMGVKPLENGNDFNLNGMIDSVANALKESFGNISFSFRGSHRSSEAEKEGTFEIPAGCDHVLIDASGLDMDVEVTPGDQLTYQFYPYSGLFSENLPDLEVYCRENMIVFEGVRAGSINASADLHVQLPPEIRNLFINSVGSDATVEELNLDSLICHSASGDIEIQNTQAQSVTLRSTSGDIDIKDVESDKLEISCTSGDIDVINSLGLLTVNSVSGDIDVRKHVGKEISLMAISGDIDFSGNTEQMKIKTTSGDIDLDFDQPVISVSASTLSGDISLSVEDLEEYSFDLSTFSGDVSLPRKMDYRKSGNRYSAGDGPSLITLETKSGDIDID